jgi:hypothetical protein
MMDTPEDGVKRWFLRPVARCRKGCEPARVAPDDPR